MGINQSLEICQGSTSLRQDLKRIQTPLSSFCAWLWFWRTLDAHCCLVLWVSYRLKWLRDWRGLLLATHARLCLASLGRRPWQPRCASASGQSSTLWAWVRSPSVTAWYVDCADMGASGQSTLPSRAVIKLPTVSQQEVSTVQVLCHLPIFPSDSWWSILIFPLNWPDCLRGSTQSNL